MKRWSGIVCFVALMSAGIPRAQAWWAGGHNTMTTGAVADLLADPNLPGSLKEFVTNFGSKIETQAGVEPPGNHFIDIDSYSEWSNRATFPRDESVLVAKYGQSYVTGLGEAPWTAANYMQQLTTMMKTAVAETDYSKRQQDWQNMVVTAGAMSHYIEDLHNPMHTAKNYDGQLTGQSGLHSRYEGYMLENGSASRYPALTSAMAGGTYTYIPSLTDAIFDDISNTTFELNSQILSADLAARAAGSTSSVAYRDAMWASCGAFTSQQFNNGAEMVASAFYTAYVNATPEPATLSLLLLSGLSLIARHRSR